MTDDEILLFFRADAADGSDESAIRIGRAIEKVVRAQALEEAAVIADQWSAGRMPEHAGLVLRYYAIAIRERIKAMKRS